MKVLKLVSLLFVVMMMCSFGPHKFYVSKTTIEFNPRTQGFEVTVKLFTDDLEKAMGSSETNPVRLGTEKEPSDSDQRIEKYLLDHLRLWFNDQSIQMRFVGKEVDGDLTFCYLEFFREVNYHVVKVENTILYEVYPEQQNIVDLTINGTTKTVILLQSKPADLIIQ